MVTINHYQYEHEMITHYCNLFPNRKAWHWSVIPEDLLFECGYIHDYNKTRLDRLKKKKERLEGINRVSDYGFDGFPLRKDFPLIGYSEIIYDFNKKRIISKPCEFSQDFRFFLFENSWL